MKSFDVQPGEHVSPDVGLSDDLVVSAIDDAGEEVIFHIEPREWLEEWEFVSSAKLPSGAAYARQLVVSGEWFRVEVFGDPDHSRHYRFTVFDVPSRTNRTISLSEAELVTLVAQIRGELAS